MFHAISQFGDDFRVDVCFGEHVVELLRRGLVGPFTGGKLWVNQGPIGLFVWLFKRRHEEDESFRAQTENEHQRGSLPVLDFEKCSDDDDGGAPSIELGHKVFPLLASWFHGCGFVLVSIQLTLSRSFYCSKWTCGFNSRPTESIPFFWEARLASAEVRHDRTEANAGFGRVTVLEGTRACLAVVADILPRPATNDLPLQSRRVVHFRVVHVVWSQIP